MKLRFRIAALCAALFSLAILPQSANAAGTIPLALSVQVDSSGSPVPGCILYFFQAGTVATPQNSYSDFGLSQNPLPILTCDQSSRLPMFWLADGLVHARLTDSNGAPILDVTMQVLGPSSGGGGGGGGGTVDPTTILATGDVKAKYGTGSLTGFVRANGLTIGTNVSGATERANADTQALFVYLYGADPNLVVSGGRTGNALADFSANKTITLPDWRGRALAGLDDMGNTAAGRLTSPYFGCTPTVLGCGGGLQNYTLLTPNLPPYTPSGSIANGAVTLNGGSTVASIGQSTPNNNGPFTGSGGFGQNIGLAIAQAGSTFSGAAQGGTDTPFATVSPMLLTTFYIKL